MSVIKLIKYSLLLFVFLISSIVPALSVQAAFNEQINYQGKLTDSTGALVADGDYNMEFKLYTVSSAGTAIWTETRTGANVVTVTNGLFSVMLGSVTSLSSIDFNQTLYLGVNIGGTGTPSWDGEMSPRKVLGAVAAAIQAKNVISSGRIDLAYAPADDTNPGIKIDYSPSVASSNNAVSILTGSNVTGAALNISSTGTGNVATLDTANASANGVSIDVQSSSSSQYVFSATSNNGATTGLYVRADGNVGIGDATPAALLTVGSGDLFQVSSAGDITGVSLNVAAGTITSGLINGQTISSAANFTGTVTVATSTTSPILYGSSAANGDVTIEGTSSATKGSSYVILQPTGGNVGIGDSTPTALFTVGDGDAFRVSSTGEITGRRIDLTNTVVGGSTITSTNLSTTSGNLKLEATSVEDFVPNLSIASTQTATGTINGFYGINNSTLSSAVVTGVDVGQSLYGTYNIISKDGADTATGTYNTYADYNWAINTGRTDVGTVNTYGGYFKANGDTAGASTAYGLYTTASGADTNYGVYSAAGYNYFAGNVGIGSASPASASLQITQQGIATGAAPDPILKLTGGTHALASNAEVIDVDFTGLARSVQFTGSGTLATQRSVVISAPTYSAVLGYTVTNASTVAISGAPIKGDNVTLTNTHALLISAGAVSTATNSYGLSVNAQTGATNNYAAQFMGGNVGIGDSSPAALLTVGSGDLFQVSSAGAITGVSLTVGSGTITSGLINGQTISSAANFTGTVAVATSVSTPSLITASGALTVTPAAGSNLNVNLSTTGDFAVNTDQLYVDTSVSKIGIGITNPTLAKLQIAGGIVTGLPVNAMTSGIGIKQSTNALTAAILLESSSNTNNGGMYITDTELILREGGIDTLNANGGNVGIGITPTERLHVLGPSASAEAYSVIGLLEGAGSSTQLGVLQLKSFRSTTASLQSFALQVWQRGSVGTTAKNLLLQPDGGNVGIGMTAPAAGLHVVSTNGMVYFADSATDATNKFARIGLPHYTNSEEPAGLIFASSSSTSNSMSIGGGSSLFNAATNIDFYTAATNTTTTGTLAMTISSAQNVGIGTTPSSTARLSVEQNGTGFKFTGASNQAQLVGYTTSAETIGHSVRWAATAGTGSLTSSNVIGDVVFSIIDGGANPLKGKMEFRYNRGDGLTTGLALSETGSVSITPHTTSTVDLDISKATGSATLTPTALRISSTTSAADFDTTNPWGRLDFYSADASGSIGAGVRARIGSVFNNTAGSQTQLLFYTSNSTDTAPIERLRIRHDGYITIASSDMGDGVAGPVLTIGRNTNATNTGAGSVNYLSKGGTDGYVWQDNAGNMRIHTAAPTNANDTAGTVIGAQTSTRETKQDILEYSDYQGALEMVVSAPLHTFRYKNDVAGYGEGSELAKTRIGYIADEVPAEFMWGNVIDQVSVNGILMASVKEIDKQINSIKSDMALSMSEPTSANVDLVIEEHLYLSGDSIGQGKILAGSTEVRITFVKKYKFQPIITISALDRFVPAYVKDVDETGFTIAMETPIVDDVILNWHAFAGETAKLTVSNGTTEDIVLVVVPVEEPQAVMVEGSSTDSDAPQESVAGETVVAESQEAPISEEVVPAESETPSNEVIIPQESATIESVETAPDEGNTAEVSTVAP